MFNPDEMMRFLSSDVFLSIAIECIKEPKTALQIANALGYKGVNVGMWLKQLELQGILKYTPSGWKTSDEAAAIIQKYFI